MIRKLRSARWFAPDDLRRLSRRAGLPLMLDDFHAAGQRVPVLASIRPSGQRCLMAQMGDLIDGTARSVTGRTLGEEIAGAETLLPDVIRSRENPVSTEPAMAVLRGMLPIPKYLLEQGIRDMLRISDARMSGTSYGARILHIAPEAYVCGPLALVRSGDTIAIDAPAGRLDMEVPEAELTRRRQALQPPEPRFGRGYGWSYARNVLQADKGCDFDFLETGFGTAVPEPEIL